MCLAQDDKRKAGTAAGFGSERHGKPSCTEGLNEQPWEMYLCVYVSDDTENKCLGQTSMLKSSE